MKWEDLPFRERAEYIRVGVKNGLRNIDDIKGAYNKFQDGGFADNFTTEKEAGDYANQFDNAGIFYGDSKGSNIEDREYTYPLDEVVIKGRDLSKPYESFLDRGDVFNFREMAYNSSPIKRMEYMRDLASYSDDRNDFSNYYNLIRNKYQPLDSVITNEAFKHGYVNTPSSKEMEDFYRGRIKEANHIPIIERFGNAAQNAFLLNPSEQDTLMTNQGYTRDIKSERNKDYGLVQRAVGNRNLPIYQKYPDATSRDSLKVIGNVTAKSYRNSSRKNREGNWFGNKGTLVHAGKFPTALYVNPTSGELYQKGWDLNDYVGTSGLLDSYSEIVGNPLVVTTGIQKLDWPNLDLPDIWDKETVDSLKSIYPNIQLDSEYFKSRKHNKKSLGGNIYGGDNPNGQKMQIQKKASIEEAQKLGRMAVPHRRGTAAPNQAAVETYKKEQKALEERQRQEYLVKKEREAAKADVLFSSLRQANSNMEQSIESQKQLAEEFVKSNNTAIEEKAQEQHEINNAWKAAIAGVGVLSTGAAAAANGFFEKGTVGILNNIFNTTRYTGQTINSAKDFSEALYQGLNGNYKDMSKNLYQGIGGLGSIVGYTNVLNGVPLLKYKWNSQTHRVGSLDKTLDVNGWGADAWGLYDDITTLNNLGYLK